MLPRGKKRKRIAEPVESLESLAAQRKTADQMEISSFATAGAGLMSLANARTEEQSKKVVLDMKIETARKASEQKRKRANRNDRKKARMLTSAV